MIKTYLNDKREIVELAMEQFMLAPEGPFKDHIEAMRYSLFAGGKRVRPILCLAAAETIDDSREMRNGLLPVAIALECIHTYSLIHDDLPAMDDDDLRRGKPTNHILFGEAGAVLAGDGLLTFAFELLARDNPSLDGSRQLKIIELISKAAGSIGMVGGQSLDIMTENQEYPFETLKTIHRYKTGSLITASVLAGAIGSGASEEELAKLRLYGDNIGLAFQIVDDLLNVTSTAEELGKAAGSDAERGKATYPGYYGVEQTRRLAMQAVERSHVALSDFDDRAEPLRELATYIYTRTN